MAVGTNKLTNTGIQSAAAKPKAYKLADGGGLYLLVERNDFKYWRMAYRFAGKQKLLSPGVYPTVSLKAARLARKEARAKFANDIDSIIIEPNATKTKDIILLETKGKISKSRIRKSLSEP